MLSLDTCYDHCRTIALSHYENFPVGSVLIPKELRKHIYALYAFMRTADDIADVPGKTSEERLEQLGALRLALTDGSDDPIVTAVRNTFAVKHLDPALLHRLLDAFEFDARGDVQFDTFADLRWYTARSAEPVGELILQLFGYRDDGLLARSNEITSALQLLNFIQDVREDLEHDRYYFPREDYERFGISMKEEILSSPNVADLLRLESERVGSMLQAGGGLPEFVHGRLRYELRAVILGARALLRAMERDGWSYVSLGRSRPVLTPLQHMGILVRALWGRV